MKIEEKIDLIDKTVEVLCSDVEDPKIIEFLRIFSSRRALNIDNPGFIFNNIVRIFQDLNEIKEISPEKQAIISDMLKHISSIGTSLQLVHEDAHTYNYESMLAIIILFLTTYKQIL